MPADSKKAGDSNLGKDAPVLMALLALAFLIVGTGLVVWSKQPGSRWHGLCAMFSLASALWPIALYFIGVSTTPGEATLWTRMTFVGPTVAAMLYVVIVRSFAGTAKRQGAPWTLGMAILIGIPLLGGAFHPEVVRVAIPTPDGPRFTYGWLYPFEMLAAGLLVVLAGIEHVRAFNSLTGHRRAQAVIMFVGTTATVLLACIPNIILPLAGFSEAYRYGPYPFFVGLVATYYAMIEHRLFDVEVGLGWILKSSRYLRHVRVRETFEFAENYLNLGSLSKSLQDAFGSSEISLALLDETGHPQESFGDPALALPSDAIVHYRNGAVVMRSDVPAELQTEMQDKRLSAIVRLGEPEKPSAVVLFGNAFEEILFARQDVRLLRQLSERLNLIIDVAAAYKSSLDQTIDKHEKGWSTRTPRPAVIALHEVSSARLAVLDPGGSLGPWTRSLPIEGLHVEERSTMGEFSMVAQKPCDLAIVFAGESARHTQAVLRDFERRAADTPVVVLCPESSGVSCERLQGRHYLGSHRFKEEGREDVARFLMTAVAAGRYLRGDVDLRALASSAGRSDFMGITRAIQKRMIEIALRESRTKTEAGRRLGLSSANMSLKLKYFGFRESSRPPSPQPD